MVDDEADSQGFIAFVLAQAGASVITATTAGEALAAFTQFPIDMLLSDIRLPEMDGYMLMQQIRSFSPEQGGNVSAIALTAYAGEVDQQQAPSSGFQIHLSKPIDPEQLVNAISALCNSEETVEFTQTV